jgi:REP element-mobilizing transposase RayT|tara:strand:- start:1123 stop:1278 length:156 start_codon:yes stop_codon:yes gene_type:complete
MPRIAITSIPDVPVHVIQRVNYSQYIFVDDGDKEFYLKSLIHYKKEHKVKL